MSDADQPNPNGHEPPLTLERIDWRLRSVEGETDDMRRSLVVVERMADSMVTFGTTLERVQRLQDRICRALGIDPSKEGEPVDVTAKLRALEAKDAELITQIEATKKEGWHKLAASAGDVAKVGGKIVAALAAVTAMGWSLAQAISAGVKAVGGGGP